MAGLADTFASYHGDLALVAAAVGATMGLALRLVGRPSSGRLGVAAAGSILVGAGQHVVGWGTAAVAAAVLLAVGTSLRRPDSPLVGLLAAISAVGVFAAVPDTELPVIAAATVGTVVVVGAVLAPTVGDRVAAVGLLALVATVGAAGRSELIGGLACVGLLLAPSPRRPDRRAVAVTALHTGVVLVAARVITRWSWIESTAAAVALLATASVLTVRLAAGDVGDPGASGGTGGHAEDP